MNIKLNKKQSDFLFETPLLHQSSFWSHVKEKQGYSSLACDIKIKQSEMMNITSSAYMLDDILVLIHPIDNYHTIGYIPYGPLLKPEEDKYGNYLEELSEQLRSFLPDDCILLRYDLPWLSLWEQEAVNPEMQELRLNWGTNCHNLSKSISNQLPVNTLIIDISKAPEEILSNMKAKTRYNIKLAYRKGIKVRVGTKKDLDIFYHLYSMTCKRNNLNLHDVSFFSSLFDVNNTGDFDLLIAELNGEPLSSLFLTYSSKRATYLYGASSNENRETMSTYALQWEAINLAKKKNCTEYDLFGIAPNADIYHPMHGLNRFKMGFGGEVIKRMGCWDYVFNKEKSQELYNFEMTSKGYHK